MTDKSFGFKIDDILETNKDRSFERIKPSKIRKALDKVFREGKPMGWSSCLKILDAIFRWRRKGGFYLFTGYDQSGKSEILKDLTRRACEEYDWKCAVYSPEEETEDMIEDLARNYLNKNVNKNFRNQCTPEEWSKAMDWIEEHYVFIEYDGMIDFENLMEEFTDLAENEGVNMFVIDPWNYIAEGAMDNNNFSFLKIAFSHLKTFSRRHKAQMIVVEHQNSPAKPNKEGEIPRATRWGITGGSMTRNKPDCIVIMHSFYTEESKDTRAEFEVTKSKQQRYNGVKGTRALWFDLESGRYKEGDGTEGEANQMEISLPDKKGAVPANTTPQPHFEEDDDLPF